jgi:CspA family cold shock protein
MKGKVKFYNVEKRFGFITGEDDNEYFVHVSKFAEGTDALREEQEVEFEPAEGERGPIATDIKGL